VLRSIHANQTGHGGTSLSMIEILVALYFRHLRHAPDRPDDPDRDRFILSKGHGAPALYATLAEAGYLPHDELLTLRKLGSRLQGHPSALALPGVDACTGSLGQGLSIGLGLAMAAERRAAPTRVYCMLGDGELQEGQNWEAAMAASAYGVARLIAVVDRNGLQGDGNTESVLALGDLEAKWSAFGWHAQTVDGHDFEALDGALTAAIDDPRPSVVIAQTLKGKGVSYMEGVVHWHHHPVSDAELAIGLRDIDGGDERG
jgi:transketolase